MRLRTRGLEGWTGPEAGARDDRSVRRSPRSAAIAALLALGLGGAAATAAAAPAPGRVLIDDFEDVSSWSAHPASGVELAISPDGGAHGRALRLDFRFSGGGYAVARRAVDLELPENYRFRFAIRGECRPNDLELKLIDASGDNVWWCNRRGFHFPERWESLSTRKRQITFAWGPAGGGEIRRVASIEIAITAGSGGAGTVWLDDFTLEPLPPPAEHPPAPRASASSRRSGHDPAAAVDGAASTSWAGAAGESRPWLALDLGVEREFGGLALDWEAGRHPRDYAVEFSDDGTKWRTVREVRGSNGGRDHLNLPESETRRLRVRATGGVPAAGVAITELALRPLEEGATLNAFFGAIARERPRGDFPRGLRGEPSSWSVVGLDGGLDEALLGQDGMLETGAGQCSIEPFIGLGGRLLGWADARIERRLAEGRLPIPTVTWTLAGLELSITAFALADSPGVPLAWRELVQAGPGVVARYRLRNRGAAALDPTLFLALRPFQVNPPVQFLNAPGGVAPIRELEYAAQRVRVNRDRGVVCVSPPADFDAAPFDAGDAVERLRAGWPERPRPRVEDPFGHASGTLRYPLRLEPGREAEVVLFIPFGAPPPAPFGTAAAQVVQGAESAARAGWKSRLQRFTIDLPDSAAEVVRTLEAQLAWILINRDGPAIQPGSRSYARSWIRDGALTSSALLRLGQPEPVREFVKWFARHQYPDGKVPCCVDGRGADPVPEHDSHGELIHLIAEYHRYTGDRATVDSLWPAVAGAVRYLDTLRAQRRGAEWRAPEKAEFYGLLPPSISHEGYSAKPMHSYWDDFFALRGYQDALELARALDRSQEIPAIERSRDEFRRDLSASIRAAMSRHGIDYVPGCADLGDFDATSTTIALAPAEAESLLPRHALERTFARYWDHFRERRDGVKPWQAYTPYEIRNVGAFARLGWRQRAQELLDFFLADRNPPEWAQWAEVVWSDPDTARFFGDLPHTWVGSDYVRSVLDLLAYPRVDEQQLVIGAGVPLAWVTRSPGVVVRGLATPWGPLGYRMKTAGNAVEVRIDGGLEVPKGGLVVNPPARRAFRSATVNGAPAKLERGTVMVREVPATVVLRP